MINIITIILCKLITSLFIIARVAIFLNTGIILGINILLNKLFKKLTQWTTKINIIMNNIIDIVM